MKILFIKISRFLLVSSIIFLAACAHSDLERETTCQIDQGVIKNTTAICNLGNVNIADKYQSANQATKGFWLGGAAGAVTGQMTTVGLGPGALMGAILGGAIGSYIDEHTTLLDRIENQGVKVLILGDQVKFVIPSANIFSGMTSCIRPEAYCVLSQIAQLICCFPNISVEVAAYTNDVGPAAINQALSQEQAESVVKYLWKIGICTRLIYALGKGPCKLIEMSCGCWDQGNNYRIEITLEKLPCSRCCG